MENNIIIFLDALDNFLKDQDIEYTYTFSGDNTGRINTGDYLNIDLEVWSHTEHDKCIELFPEGTKFNA